MDEGFSFFVLRRVTVPRASGRVDAEFRRRRSSRRGSWESKAVVKTLSKRVSTKQLGSFKEEVAAMCLLDHPNITKSIDSFEDDANSFIAMEHTDGEDLKNSLQMDQWTSWLV